MSDHAARLNYLYERFITDTGTAEEIGEFWSLLQETEESHPLRDAVYRLYEEQVPPGEDPVDWTRSLRRILDGVKNRPFRPHVFPVRRSWWAVAASLVLLGAGVCLWRQTGQPGVKTAQNTRQLIDDVRPGTTRAVLTLADGRKITLDSARSGSLAIQGKTTVAGNNGAITYDGKTTELLYNTLSTGRGEQSPVLTLADGTRVWLNAASSIRFPVAFAGDARTVEITGEAYFEVAPNPAKPFVVTTSSSRIAVLGTHFDVMAYEDEPFIHTTLLAGSVQFGNAKEQKVLRPGEQGRISHATGDLSIRQIDTEQAVAWLHGQLPMKYMDVAAFMRQVSRWYDVDIVFEGKLPVLSFSGSLDKKVNLSYILSALEDNGIHCKLEGKKVTVSPQ